MSRFDDAVTTVNAGMVAFDLALGSGAILAPDQTLALLGHDKPSDDARQLFRRCGPIWLTFAAAHAIAAVRGEPRDWWALSWLRATEIATDALWAGSDAIPRPFSKLSLRGAGVANLAFTVAFAARARRTMAAS
jgi:hypothetical protein